MRVVEAPAITRLLTLLSQSGNTAVRGAQVRRAPKLAWAGALLMGCASQPAPPVATGPSAAASPSAASVDEAKPDLPPPGDLLGTWVEFWALNGQADTDRYAFFEDGRFVWEAAQTPVARIARRWGHFRFESVRDRPSVLLLLVEGHEERFGCEGSANCRVIDTPPEQERLTLGECPPNEEAKTLDASYRCIGIGGRAFFRRAAEPKR